MKRYYNNIGRVIAGKYEGHKVDVLDDGVPCIIVSESRFKYESIYPIQKKYFDKYEIINQEIQTSTKSAYKKSLVGGFFFGDAGAIAGAASAKQESTYTVTIYYKTGEKSLIKIDGIILEQIQKELF